MMPRTQGGVVLKGLIPLILLISSPLFAKTQMAQLVEQTQVKLAEGQTSYPILIFEKDELDWRFMKNQAFGKDKIQEAKRSEIIKAYVFEKTKVVLTDNDATNFEPYLTIMKDSAVALPLHDSYSGPAKICGVFPADPNSNQRLEMERILGLGLEEAYGQIGYAQIKPKISYEDLALFSLYHEVGHCLDQEFMPKTFANYDDSHGIHQSESFAETFALLALAREGKADLGTRRAAIRTIYSQKLGKFLATHPQNGFGNPNYVYGGIIYYLSPVLTKRQKLIEQDLESIKAMSTQELLQLAKNIVDENSLHSRVFQGLYSVLAEGEESTMERYRRFSEEMPDLFGVAYPKLKYYVEKIKFELETEIDLSAENVDGNGELAPIDQDQFCYAALDSNSDLFFSKIDELRLELRSTDAPVVLQRERQANLKSLAEVLSNKCF